MAETTPSKGPLPSSGTFDPQYSSVIRPYETINRRPTYARFLYALAIATLVCFLCVTFFRSMVEFVPGVG